MMSTLSKHEVVVKKTFFLSLFVHFLHKINYYNEDKVDEETKK